MSIVSKEQLPECAREILQKVQKKSDRAFLVFLSGNLGAGKTTFMQAFAKELGVPETLQSPTFVLMKKYEIGEPDSRGDAVTPGLSKATPQKNRLPFSTLVHIDAYRLEDATEFAALKPEEFLNDPQNIVAIEWAENIRDALPEPDLVLKFSSEGMEEGEREIQIEDPRFKIQE